MTNRFCDLTFSQTAWLMRLRVSEVADPHMALLRPLPALRKKPQKAYHAPKAVLVKIENENQGAPTCRRPILRQQRLSMTFFRTCAIEKSLTWIAMGNALSMRKHALFAHGSVMVNPKMRNAMGNLQSPLVKVIQEK